MREAEMKNNLIKINNDFYDNLSKEMIVLREKCINDLKTIQTHGSHLNKTQTFTYIYHLVAELSFFNDDEVLEVLSGFGITKLTTKFFQPFGEFFESLDLVCKNSKFLCPYETIWGFYKSHNQSFFKIQLSTDLGLNLSKITKKVNRQENNNTIPDEISNLYKDIKVSDRFFKSEISYYNSGLKEKNTTNSIFHQLRFSHKVDYRNLYNMLLDFNKEGIGTVYEPDFKFYFYDLLELLLKDQSLLKNDPDTQLKYGDLESRRFKIKRVERLVLS